MNVWGIRKGQRVFIKNVVHIHQQADSCRILETDSAEDSDNTVTE